MLKTSTFLFLLFSLSSCQDDPERLALGTLERDRISHSATINEVIVELPISAGSIVSKGDVLVRLDDRQQKAMVARALAEQSQSQANLEKLTNGAREEEVSAASANVDAARASLTRNKANYQRIKDLAQKKLSSQAELDTSLAAYDESAANLRSSKDHLRELTNGTRIEDLRIAEAILASKTASLVSEQKKLADLTITATRDGILDNLPWNLGERVTLGSPLAIVLAGEAPFARVYVPEPYRVKIKIGDSLNVRIDGLSEKLPGKVRWISNEPAFTPYYALNQKERAGLMYLMEVNLAKSASGLPSGLPAQVELP